MQNVIEELKNRGFIDQISSEELIKVAEAPLKVYVGFDPTADSLHLGNLVGIIALAWFQKFGHTPYVILGGATGRIGDPSGKSIERPLLQDEEILGNIARLKSFFKNLPGSSSLHPSFVILNNNDWFSQFHLVDFLRDVGKQFRMGPMLAKESVKSRLTSEEGMSFTEFSYQILQGYDFYHLQEEHGVILQMGGSDQWGNITAGIELTRKMSRKSLYGLTFPLLTRSDGKKFGKSEEGAIWLDKSRLSSYQFYQYLMRVPDADVGKLLRILTFLSLEEIQKIEVQTAHEPNYAQKRLAQEVTRFVHGDEGVTEAEEATRVLAPGALASLNREELEKMEATSFTTEEVLDKRYTDLAVMVQLVESKSEMVRLIKNGGAYLNNQKIGDPNKIITTNDFLEGQFLLMSVGKKRRVLIKII